MTSSEIAREVQRVLREGVGYGRLLATKHTGITFHGLDSTYGLYRLPSLVDALVAMLDETEAEAGGRGQVVG